MTLRERILAVYRGQTPDVVPFMLDLSHWFYHKHHLPWDLTATYDTPEHELISYHKKIGAGFYMPNLGSFYNAAYGSNVRSSVTKKKVDGNPEICWRIETPLGAIERNRRWEESTYSWAITRWGVQTETDLRVLGYALGSRLYKPLWERYHPWRDAVGDSGVVYLGSGYSAIGLLLNYWMGVAETIYAAADWPDLLDGFIDQVNANNLVLIDLLAESPAEIVIMGDNFSGDVQPPAFFNRWSRPYYAEAIRRLHKAGKHVAVHIDGLLRGAIGMIRDTGADCADAITPAPMGDLTAVECSAESGSGMILSGGVPPNLWLPNTPLPVFEKSIMDWLELRKSHPRLIAAAGDQVPPFAEEQRISIMRDLVETYGRF